VEAEGLNSRRRPLGTNALAAETAFYNPANREQQIGTILESDNAYVDGTIEPARLVKSKVLAQ